MDGALGRGELRAAGAAAHEMAGLALQGYRSGWLADPGGDAPPTTEEAVLELTDAIHAYAADRAVSGGPQVSLSLSAADYDAIRDIHDQIRDLFPGFRNLRERIVSQLLFAHVVFVVRFQDLFGFDEADIRAIVGHFERFVSGEVAPSRAFAAAQLFNDVRAFAGIEPVVPDDIDPTTTTVELVEGGQEETVRAPTPAGESGPLGAVTLTSVGEGVLVLQALDPEEDNVDNPEGTDEYPFPFDISLVGTELAGGAVVTVCAEAPVEVIDRLRIGHDLPDGTFELLSRVSDADRDPEVVDACEGTGDGGEEPIGWIRKAGSTLGELARSLVTVRPAHAVQAALARRGLGGLAGSLSPFSPVDPEAESPVEGIPLTDQETVFHFDLSNLAPQPPYENITWTVTFSGDDPVAGTDTLFTRVYGGANGTQLLQIRNSTDLVIEDGGGTELGPLTTANPLFDPMLDGVFSFGMVMERGTATVVAFEACGNADTGEGIEQACQTIP